MVAYIERLVSGLGLFPIQGEWIGQTKIIIYLDISEDFLGRDWIG